MASPTVIVERHGHCPSGATTASPLYTLVPVCATSRGARGFMDNSRPCGYVDVRLLYYPEEDLPWPPTWQGPCQQPVPDERRRDEDPKESQDTVSVSLAMYQEVLEIRS